MGKLAEQRSQRAANGVNAQDFPLSPAKGEDSWFPGYCGPGLDTQEQREGSSCCQVHPHPEVLPNHVSSLGLNFLLCKMGIMTELASLDSKDERRQYSRVL